MAGPIALVITVLFAMTLTMTVSWTVQRALDNGGWTDVFWTFGTGVSLALAAVATTGATRWRSILVAAMVALWSLRLGVYVMHRVASGPEDARYAQFRREWGPAFQKRMLGLSLVQGPASALLAISVVLAARAPGAGLEAGDIVGVAIFALAVGGEALADNQMKRFKSDPAHHNQVCEAGLWAWSRHPNYFFEWLGWCAYPAIAVRLAEPWTLASLAAPVLMFALLRFGSGVPPLEAAMLRSRGEAYRRYQARVSPMFPFPPRRAAQ